MKNFFKTVLLVLIICFATSCKANSAVLSEKFIKDKIKSDVEAQVKTKINGKIRVEIQDLPFKKIETSSKDIDIKTNLNLKYFNPVVIVRVSIITDGNTYKSFTAQAKINVYKNIWVAKDFIKRGETLKNVVLEEKDISQISGNFVGEEFNPFKYVSSKNYNPNDVINPDFIRMTPSIVKDSPVSVIFQTGTVSVTVTAKALSSGNIGEYIKVRNRDYKKDYVGKIIGENTVLVNI